MFYLNLVGYKDLIKAENVEMTTLFYLNLVGYKVPSNASAGSTDIGFI